MKKLKRNEILINLTWLQLSDLLSRLYPFLCRFETSYYHPSFRYLYHRYKRIYVAFWSRGNSENPNWTYHLFDWNPDRRIWKQNERMITKTITLTYTLTIMGYLINPDLSMPGGNSKRALAVKPPATGTSKSSISGNTFSSSCSRSTEFVSYGLAHDWNIII